MIAPTVRIVDVQIDFDKVLGEQGSPKRRQGTALTSVMDRGSVAEFASPAELLRDHKSKLYAVRKATRAVCAM